MRHRRTTREAGFSLMEMVVAMALGTIVLGAAVQIYIQGLNATMTVSQRAELQQDFRAASNMEPWMLLDFPFSVLPMSYQPS